MFSVSWSLSNKIGVTTETRNLKYLTPMMTRLRDHIVAAPNEDLSPKCGSSHLLFF